MLLELYQTLFEVGDMFDIDRSVRDINAIDQTDQERGDPKADHDGGQHHRLHQWVADPFSRIDRIDRLGAAGEPRNHDEEVNRVGDQDRSTDNLDEVVLQQEIGPGRKQNTDGEGGLVARDFHRQLDRSG